MSDVYIREFSKSIESIISDIIKLEGNLYNIRWKNF